MEIGQIIKKRREELGMSQEELAQKVGYKSRSSINKIEVDGRGLPQSKIAAIAKALDTTPTYLMGWEESVPHYIFTLDDGSKINIEYMEPAKQKAAQRLLTYYFKLNAIGQKKALENIEDLSKIYS
ncbi:MAG: helix-turn-helix domain-containing protein, partial [[Clostridium] symbiosum]